MAQGMDAYQSDKRAYQEGRFGPRKKPAGAAGAALKSESVEEMMARHEKELAAAEEGEERGRVAARHLQERRGREGK